MGFLPAMQSDLSGIRATKPLRFRALEGAVVDLWHAEGQAGGCGHYTAPHPRAVLFLENGAQAVQLSARHEGWEVICQAHVQNLGWLPQVGDGQTCGTTGRSLRLEAVRVWMVPTGTEQ